MSKEINPFYQKIFDEACVLGDIILVKQFMDKVELENGFLIAQKKEHDSIIKLLANEINRQEKRKQRKFKMLLIKYNVKGFDHSGYCSGNDVTLSDNEEPDEWEHLEITETDEYHDGCFITDSNHEQILKPDYFEDFKTRESGCTSENGSGYCRGMWQEYTPSKIYWIKNKISSPLTRK
jgi:hypothetical protein